MLRLQNIDETKMFFTSDLHFKHKNVIEYSGRPFSCIEEHDDKLISNINEVVGKKDYLFILGDFIFCQNIETIRSYYEKINGIKYLILGNHDLQNRMYRQSVVDIFKERMFDSLILNVNDTVYYLTHFPYAYHTGINIHGHIHSGPNTTATEKLPFSKKQYDVGVDNNNYFPASLKQIKENLNK